MQHGKASNHRSNMHIKHTPNAAGVGKCLGTWPAFSFRVEKSQGASKETNKHPSRFKQASNGVKTFPPSPMFGSGFKTNSAVPNYKASVDEIVCTLQLRWASWMMMASS